MLNNFVKSYPKPKSGPAFKYTTMVRHNGTVIAFAVNEARRVLYSVLDLSDQRSKGPLDVNYWQDNPQELLFPNEIVTVGEGLFNPRAMPVFKKGSADPEPEGTRVKENEKDLFRSTTASLSAGAPIQVLSDNKFVYVFRQSTENESVGVRAGTLLVDRFVLSGATLKPKREVRYQRSRNKYAPQSRKDGLGAKDMEQQPFFEPTQKLEFIHNLKDGRLAALLLPTQIAGLQRWQIFAYNDKTAMIDSFNIERDSDGLFNLQGTQNFTCPDHPQVFQLKGGECPEPATADPSQNCPYELIPILSKEGYAEWALKFDGTDDAITLQNPLSEANGNYQCIEFWLKPEDFNAPQTLLEIPGQESGRIVIDTEGKLQYSYLSQTAPLPAVEVFGSGVSLPAGEWSHIALVRDSEAGALAWYLNGEAAAMISGIEDAAETARELSFGSGAAGNFKGLLDEVRMWSRFRLQEEIAEDMRHRLIGYEPGLFLYWRFDEGGGNTINDQTEEANRGLVSGEAEWPESDAPVGDHPGIRRSSFRFDGRNVVSGMSALLYYQQKKNKSGYDGQEKPLKTSARVMLAVATFPETGGEPGQNHIAILDFGLSREGKLAQVPDNIRLQDLEVSGDRKRTSREIQNEISFLEEQEPLLEKLISELNGNLNIPSDLPFLDAVFRKHASANEADKIVFVRNNVTIKWDEGGIEYEAAAPSPKVLSLASWVYDDGVVAEFVKTEEGASVSAVEQVPQGQTLEPVETVGTPEWLEAWTSWDNNEGQGEGAFISGKKFYYFKGNKYKVFDWETREFAEPLAINDPNSVFPNLWEDGVDAAFDHSDGTTIYFFKGPQYKSYQVEQQGFSELEQGDIHDIFPGVPFLFVHPEYNGNLPDLAAVEQQLAELQNQLLILRQELAEAQRRELENLEVEIEMFMVHTDPFGLSTLGGLLTFAWTADAPQLFDSANGKLALYFQGADDQFYVTYYDTMTASVTFETPAEGNSKVYFIPRVFGPIDGTLIKIEGEDPEICSATLKNQALKLSETWDHLPRSAPDFAAVLNGQGAPLFLGRLGRNISGNVRGVKIDNAAAGALKPGRVLRLGTDESKITGTAQLTALAFDGDDDYLELPGNLIGEAGTIEMWIQFSASTKDQTIFDVSTPESSPDKGKFFFIDINDNKLRFALEDSADKDFTAQVNFNSLNTGSEWHHLAAVWNYNDNKVARLYLDGEAIAHKNGTAGTPPQFLNPFLGKSRSGYKTRGMFKGQIAEISIRNEALTAEQVKARKELNLFGINPEPLLGCWRFQEVNGAAAALDFSAHQQDGTIYGGAALQPVENGGLFVMVEPLLLSREFPAGEPVYVDYDYASNTVFNHRGKENRSVIFAVDALQAEGALQNAHVTDSGMPSPMTRWIAYAQGSALEFDGINNDVKADDPEKLPDFGAEGDLTLEAWVRPEPVVGRDFSRIVHHYSDESLYLLGFQRKQLKSAMSFSADQDEKAAAWASGQSWSPFLGNNWAVAAKNAAITEYNKPNTSKTKVANAAEKAARDAIHSGFFFLRNLINYEKYRVGEIAREWAEKWYDAHKDYVEVKNRDNLNPGSRAWTVELWFKAGRISGQNILYNKDFVYEAAVMDGFFQFAWQPHWVWVKVDNFAVAPGQWYHAAIVYDGEYQRVYKNGQLVLERAQTGAMGAKDIDLLIAARYLGDPNNGPQYFFKGAVDEVRIWDAARSREQIFHNMNRRLRGDEENLQGYWHFDQELALDYSGNENHGFVKGTPAVADSAMPGYAITAGIGGKIEGGFSETYIQTKDSIPFFDWNHLAAVYNASYALRFTDDGAFLDCGNNATLSLGDDLTIEVFLRLEDLRQPRGLLTKGEVKPAYSLYINQEGRLVFTFMDETGKENVFTASADSALEVGKFYRVAVTRRHQSQTRDVEQRRSINGEIVTVTIPEVEEWDDIEIHVCEWQNGGYRRHIGYSKKYGGPKPGNNPDNLVIGRASAKNAAPFKGIISEVRLWSRALGQFESCQNIIGVESGLVSWWRLEENKGYAAEDFTGTNHASINLADWIKNPDPQGSSLRILNNGVFMETEQVAAPGNARATKFFAIGPLSNGAVKDSFKGTVEELRIWRSVRTQEQIQDNLFLRLLGEKEDLIAYYTFDQTEEDVLKDHSFCGNDVPVHGAAFTVSDAPISYDSFQVRNALLAVKTAFHEKTHGQPGVQEYGDMQYDAEGNLIGILKRCYSYIRNGQWYLSTGYKVGNLLTEWIGQVQFNPELKGFIEGAPPVPSENLTAGPVNPAISDYTGRASVEVVEADTVTYTYATSKEAGLNASFGLSAQFGVDTTVLLITAPLGIGTAQEVADVNVLVGLEGKFSAAAGWSSENAVGIGRNLTKSTKITLGGNWEDPTRPVNAAMRRRYQPANMGFALVQSETADVFALRLEHNLALVSFQFRPNPDIPKDWNIIPFPINPRYTKQGTLDGAIGYDERGKVLDPDYPNAREYGEHSYFKPKEAYSLKNRIIKEEQELANYFRSVDTNLGGAPDLAISAGLGLISGAAKGGAAGAIEGLVSALGSSGLPEKLGKQNVANTYVWTADGGFFAETTETMSMKRETTGGTFSFSGEVGAAIGVDFSVAGVDVSLGFSAMLGGSLNLTKTKTKESENSFRIDITVDTPGDLQAYDENLNRQYDNNGNPIIVPGKVDAYRFLTFYLEPANENFDAFFNTVIDPIWLQGSHPNALALKQAQQAGKKPPCWRVMHRVTFVSRILPEIPDASAPPLEKNMKAANIESNWQLIKKLEPFVRGKTANFVEFSDAIRKAIKTYLPELTENQEEIIQYLSAYYQVYEE